MKEQYKHKLVRDLAWSVQSPSLINDVLCIEKSLFTDAYLEFREHLQALDKNPQPLIDYLESKNTYRLGHYFEKLIYYWIEYSNRFSLIDSNIQIASNNRITQGEVDLVLYDKIECKYQHWELSIKYFLAYKENENQVYIGPNANDFLHKKLKKLKDKQCKILESDAGKVYLKQKNISTIESKLFVKGCLFYHPKQSYHQEPEINSEHLHSWWIYESELEKFLKDKEKFSLLHKKEWLSTPQIQERLLSKEQCLKTIKESLNNSPRSIYIACYKHMVLQSMGFVVHNDWPNI